MIEHIKHIQVRELQQPEKVMPKLGDITTVVDIYDEIKDTGHLHQGFVHRYNEIVEKINNLIDYRNKHESTIR